MDVKPNTTWGVTTVSREYLAQEVHDLLNLPPPKHKIKTSKAAKIVNAVFQAIINGLMRGEKVVVHGFGTFKVKTFPPKRQRVTYFYGKKGKKVKIVTLPERKRVVFTPTAGLKNYVNNIS